jgi:hypothetical protein
MGRRLLSCRSVYKWVCFVRVQQFAAGCGQDHIFPILLLCWAGLWLYRCVTMGSPASNRHKQCYCWDSSVLCTSGLDNPYVQLPVLLGSAWTCAFEPAASSACLCATLQQCLGSY